MVIDVKNVTVQYTLSNFREIGLKEYLIKKVKREDKDRTFHGSRQCVIQPGRRRLSRNNRN